MTAWTPIIRGNPEVVFTTDASLVGWGATREGTRTGGFFTEEEKGTALEPTHINVLESKAVFFALKALGDDIYDKHGYCRSSE